MDESQALQDVVRRALCEDLGTEDPAGRHDITADRSLPAGAQAQARIVAKAHGRLSGMDAAEAAFRALDPDVSWTAHRADGDPVAPGDLVLEVRGCARAVLAAERTALNFLQRLSGVATMAAAFAERIEGTGARILDTRKTTPGLRLLEKRAIADGGGGNHRMGLYDQILLKENHFALAGRPYEEVVASVRRDGEPPVIAEARTEDEAAAAIRGGAGVVLLDNFGHGDRLRQAVARLRSLARELNRDVELEASGGVNLETVRDVALAGVDRISVGAVTHSAPALDLSLLVEGVEPLTGGGA